MTTFTRFFIVSGILIRDNAALLVANRWGGGLSWSLPGGTIEPGEPVLDALRREFFEETGLVIERIGPLCYAVQSSASQLHEEALIPAFLVEEASGALAPVTDDVIDEAAFVPIHRLAEVIRQPSLRIPLLDFLSSPGRPAPFYFFSDERRGVSGEG